jgi:hypothetical protein
MGSLRSTWLRWGAALLAGAVTLACSQAETTKKKRPVADPSELPMDGEEEPVDPPTDPDNVNDGGTFGLSSRANDGGAKSDAGRPKPPPDPPSDGGSDSGGTTGKTYCTGPIAAGDLRIQEIMIASRTGSGDDGEWVEIVSNKNCWLNLKNVRIESPRGTQTDFVTITTDFDLAPYGTFIAADSKDPTKNHNLPGIVFAFNSSDVFKNDGDTIRVLSGTTVIDEITYPNFSNLEYGASVSFPWDCLYWSERADWNRWSYSFTKWDGVHYGTPNTDNDDVTCY